jgi:diacylglycerol kinase family enzyme
MERLWFISNVASGSADEEKCQAIEEIFRERGLTLAGRTHFPDDKLPTAATLARAEADTVVLFAGDGTINAATTALKDWDGALLILPGGTMNLLAKTLHGPADPKTIIHAAHEHERLVSLPYVACGDLRGLVGAIIGPAAAWAEAREAVRKRHLSRLPRAMVLAWRRTFSKGVRIAGVPGLTKRAQAVFVSAEHEALRVSLIDARDIRSIASLGWAWLTGDWVAARAGTQKRAPSFTISSHRPVAALFDGEPATLQPGAEITRGETRRHFLSTTSDT